MFDADSFSVDKRQMSNTKIIGRVENCGVLQCQSFFRVEGPPRIFKRRRGIPNLLKVNKTNVFTLIWHLPKAFSGVESVRNNLKYSFWNWTVVSLVCRKSERLTLGWVTLQGKIMGSPGFPPKKWSLSPSLKTSFSWPECERSIESFSEDIWRSKRLLNQGKLLRTGNINVSIFYPFPFTFVETRVIDCGVF
jgi:hypothetical protein